MGIKVVTKGEDDELKFPLLMVCEINNLIVLFSGRKSGTVIEKGTSKFSVAECRDDWYMHTFRVFNGSAILSNEA